MIAGACITPAPDTTFELTLHPLLVNGGTALDGEPEIKLVELYPDGEEVVTHIGTGGRGATLELAIRSSLPPGAQIGLLIEGPGATEDAWQPDRTLAYGQVPVDDALQTGALQLEVLLAEVDQIAELDEVVAGRRRWGGATASVPRFGTYVFGGGDPQTVNPVSDRILKLTDLDAGNVKFATAGTLPLASGTDPISLQPVEIGARTGMTATTVMVDDAPMILATGGRNNWGATYVDTRSWFLWDPATDTVVDQGDDMDTSRSAHLAVPFDNGNVLLFGGFTGGGVADVASYAVWQARSGSFERGTATLDVRAGRMLAAGAPLGRDVVVCGGFRPMVAGSPQTFEPTSGCDRIQSDGDVSEMAPLPRPLAGGAMIALLDGRLLWTGGTDQIVVEDWSASTFSEQTATGATLVYDPTIDAWTELAEMAHPRGHHAMARQTDGRILVIGGTSTVTPLYGAHADPVRCPERFDPVDDTFTLLTCTDVGQGAYPLVATTPGEEIMVVEGAFGGLGLDGAGRYGIIASGPPLTP